jgi:hypothetical protein
MVPEDADDLGDPFDLFDRRGPPPAGRMTVLELPVFWRNLWLAICISFAVLFFVGVLRFVAELGEPGAVKS